MAVIALRPKYRNGIQYKSQKSKSSNSGNKKKNVISYRSNHLPAPGNAVMLINFGEPEFCAHTGVRLPSRGIAWTANGEKFINQGAARAYAERD